MSNKHRQPASAAVQSGVTSVSRKQQQNAVTQPESNKPVEPSEERIRELAYALYEKADRHDGHDIDHWVEATAQLKAKVGLDVS